MAKLLGFWFDVVYKSGVENKAVDALSRQQGDLLNTIVPFPTWPQGRHIQEEVARDPILKEIVDALHRDPHSSWVMNPMVIFCFTRVA